MVCQGDADRRHLLRQRQMPVGAPPAPVVADRAAADAAWLRAPNVKDLVRRDLCARLRRQGIKCNPAPNAFHSMLNREIDGIGPADMEALSRLCELLQDVARRNRKKRKLHQEVKSAAQLATSAAESAALRAS